MVAEQRALPDAARDAFDAQVDVNLVPASGFVIFRNSVALPPAASLATEPADLEILGAADPSTIAMWRNVPATALEPVPGGWDGAAVDGTVFVSTEYDAGWELREALGDPRSRSAGRPASAPRGTRCGSVTVGRFPRRSRSPC